MKLLKINVTCLVSGKLRNEELIGAREGPSKINVKMILKIILRKTFQPEENLAHWTYSFKVFSSANFRPCRPYRNKFLTKQRKMDCLKKNYQHNTRSTNQIFFQKSDRPTADKGFWKHWSRTDDVIIYSQTSSGPAISAKLKIQI